MTGVASADIYRLADAMRQSGMDADATTQDVLVQSATYIKQEMESFVPVDTGKLKQSISIEVKSTSVIIGPHTDYAADVEFGTKPHIIEAKNKKALTFMVGGHRVFVKKVKHPGTKAQPYVRPAFEQWADTLGGLVGAAHIQRLKDAYDQ